MSGGPHVGSSFGWLLSEAASSDCQAGMLVSSPGGGLPASCASSISTLACALGASVVPSSCSGLPGGLHLSSAPKQVGLTTAPPSNYYADCQGGSRG